MGVLKKTLILVTLLLCCKGNEITLWKPDYCDFTVVLNVVNTRADSVKVVLHQRKEHWGFITGDHTHDSEVEGSKWFDTLFIAANDSLADTLESCRDPNMAGCSFDCDGPKDYYGWNELVINAYTTDGATVLGIDTFAICTEWEDPQCETCGTHNQSVAVP